MVGKLLVIVNHVKEVTKLVANKILKYEKGIIIFIIINIPKSIELVFGEV